MPPSPISPRPLRDAALAFVLVFSLVYVVLLLRDALNTKLRDSDELAELSGLPVLAEFPKRMQKTYYLPREATSYLRTNVLSATSSAHPKVILVTSGLEFGCELCHQWAARLARRRRLTQAGSRTGAESQSC
jgi:hypothetical protein